MNDFTFELQPFENVAQHGLQGTVGPYGDVSVFHVKPVREFQPSHMVRTQLMAEHLPEAYIDGMGIGSGKPSLTKARIEVGGVTGTLKYNPFGIRRTSRALHITHANRRYTYAATGSGSAFELRRDNVGMSFKNGDFVFNLGFHRQGSTHGPVDEVDLAIGIILQGVETDSLTVSGALATAPFRLLNSPSDGGSA